MMSRTRMWQMVAVVVSAAGLSLACGVGPRQSAPPPSATAPEPPSITFSVPRVQFDTTVGEAPMEQAVVVTNVSDHAVALSHVQLHRSNGMDDGSFAARDDCPGELPPQAHCTLTVTFTAQHAGSIQGWVAVKADGVYRNLMIVGRAGQP